MRPVTGRTSRRRSRCGRCSCTSARPWSPPASRSTRSRTSSPRSPSRSATPRPRSRPARPASRSRWRAGRRPRTRRSPVRSASTSRPRCAGSGATCCSAGWTARPRSDGCCALRDQPPRYPVWLANLGWVSTAIGIALILQPGWRNVALAAVASVVVVGLFRAGPALPAAGDAAAGGGGVRRGLPGLRRRRPRPGGGTAADAAAAAGRPAARAPCIVTAMSELAAGDMIAGSSRLTFGLVQVLLFTLGVVGASRLFDLPPEALRNVRVAELGWWAAPLGLVLICVGIGLLESPPVRLLPWILLVLVLAFGAQALGQHYSGPVLGSFLGAVAASPAPTSSRPSCPTSPGSSSSCRPSGCSCPAASACSRRPSSRSTRAARRPPSSAWSPSSAPSPSACWSAPPSRSRPAAPSAAPGVAATAGSCRSTTASRFDGPSRYADRSADVLQVTGRARPAAVAALLALAASALLAPPGAAAAPTATLAVVPAAVPARARPPRPPGRPAAPPSSAPQPSAHVWYRIPAVVRTPAGTLVAFAERRRSTGAASDVSDTEIVRARSTRRRLPLEPLRPWSPTRAAARSATRRRSSTSATGEVLLLSVHRAPGSPTTARGLHLQRSSDDGLTFTPYAAAGVDMTGVDGWHGGLTGPGHALQLHVARPARTPAASSCRWATRRTAATAPTGCVSDDHGAHWRVGYDQRGGRGPHRGHRGRAAGRSPVDRLPRPWHLRRRGPEPRQRLLHRRRLDARRTG